MKKTEETPKVMHIGGWTAAVIGAAVFAAVVGVFMYQKANAPIEAAIEAPAAAAPASTAAETCSNVALNNYPGMDVVNAGAAEYKHEIFESQMGGTWRCNEYCIPGVEEGSYTSAKSQQAIKTYLSGKTMGGQQVNVVQSGQNFQKLLLPTPNGTTMARTVILDASKKECLGYNKGKGWSTNYEKMVDANGTVTAPAVENLTAADAEKYQEDMTKQEAAKQVTAKPVETSIGSVPVSGVDSDTRSIKGNQDGQSATVTGPDGTETTVLTPETSKSEFVRCMKTVNDHLTNRSWLSKLLGKEKEYVKEYGGIKTLTGYPDEDLMTSKMPAASDVEKARENCFALSDKINTQYKVAVEAATAASSRDITNDPESVEGKILLAKSTRLVVRGDMFFADQAPYIDNETIVYARVGELNLSTKIRRDNGYFDASHPTRYQMVLNVDQSWLANTIKNKNNVTVWLFGWNSGGAKYYTRDIIDSYTFGKQSFSLATTGDTVTVFLDLGKKTLKSNYVSGLWITGGKNLPPLYERGQSKWQTVTKFKQIFGISGDFRD